MNGLKTILFVEDNPKDVEQLHARGQCLRGIAKSAESSTGYSVVGKANSSNLHMATDARLGKKRESRRATLARIFHTPRNSEPVPHTGNLRYACFAIALPVRQNL
jgi:hypothetical protein